MDMHGGRDHPGLSQDHSVYARRRYSDAGDAACLQAMSIFRLRDLCVSEGLDPRGGKEECVRRLEGAYGGQDAMLRDVQAQHVAQHALDMDAMSYQELIDLGAELGAVPKGISQAELEDLSVTHTVRAADLPALAGASCSVCLQSFVEEEKTRRLPCLHVFHTECIDPWVTGSLSRSCPVCQWDVTEVPGALEGQ